MQDHRYEVGDRIENLDFEVTDFEIEWEEGWPVRDSARGGRVVAITPMWDAASRIAHALNVIDKLELEGVVRMSFDRDVPR